jgi:hypothetical protein
VAIADPATELLEQGIALLRLVFSQDALNLLKQAAERCFEQIDHGEPLLDRYRFNRFSHSFLLTALVDFGLGGEEELLAPLGAPGLKALFSAARGEHWTCNLEQSWVRKKFAPRHAPAGNHHPQGWHQDGALGVRFPPQPGPAIPMTELLTLWIPLNPCGIDSPGLEFVRRQPCAGDSLPTSSRRPHSNSATVWFSLTAFSTAPARVRRCRSIASVSSTASSLTCQLANPRKAGLTRCTRLRNFSSNLRTIIAWTPLLDRPLPHGMFQQRPTLVPPPYLRPDSQP